MRIETEVTLAGRLLDVILLWNVLLIEVGRLVISS